MLKIFNIQRNPVRQTVGFREKMAWVMVVSILIFGTIYFVPMATAFDAVGFLPPVSAALGTLAVIALIIVATLGAIIAALSNIRDANSPLDERESSIVARAENYGNTTLALGTITIIVSAHLTDGLGWIVPGLVAVLTFSHMVTNCAQIAMFRRSQ